MKKISLVFLSFMFVVFVNAQQWTNNLPKEKASSSHTFFDYQKAFYSYWEPYNVKGGFYIDDNGEQKKAPGWKQFKRWEYFWETRTNPETGEFPIQDINTIFKQEKRAAAFNETSELWLSKGPNSSSGGYFGIGRINVIAYHPTNPDMFWVGTASGGLWVTVDGGQSWEVLNDDMQTLGVSDIIIPSDYFTSHTIYLATGDRDAFDTKSIGLLKSTDEGANWENINFNFTTNQNGMIYRALLNPFDNETIIVTGNFGTYKGSGVNGNWSKISDEMFIDMEFKPDDFNTLYGSTKQGGVFVSTNGGNDWNQIIDESQGNRTELAVSPANPLYVYAVMVNDDDGLYGVFKSENAGESFDMVYDPAAEGGLNILGWDNGDDDGGQGWYDLAIAVSPTSANFLFIGGINTWISIDGGLTWEMMNHWYGGFESPEVHADKHYLGFQTGTRNLFEGNDGGIYKTSNFTEWTDLTNGIVNSQIYRLSTSQTDVNQGITGLQDNGTKLSYYDDWYTVKGGDGAECIIDYTDEDIQYGSGVNGQISRTMANWSGSETDISDNIPGGADGAWITPYILNPVNPKSLYVGYNEIWKTEDRGDNFVQISDFQESPLQSLAISPADTNTIYAATYYTIYHTDNIDNGWIDITGTLPVSDAKITYIAVKNDDANTVWVTMSGYDGYGVWESTNAGQDWSNISDGLPDVPCNTIVQNKLNTSEVELYAGTDIGVYLKLGNDPWVFFSTGLPNVVVSELEIYYDPVTPSESKLKAATYGRGLWETKVYDSGIQTGAESLSKVIESIYPNPSTGQFRIDFKDYNGEEIEVEIRSLSGKLVYKNSLAAQTNTINLEYLADGVYVLQIQKNNQLFGQSIVIQK